MDDIIEAANRLPNLQLMDGPINQEKLTTLPAKWLADREPNAGRREKYIYLHLFEGLPETLLLFDKFYKQRREALSHRISDLLGVESHAKSVTPDV